MSGALGYAGDMSVQDAYAYLRDKAGATLVDVRTSAEWAYVGKPDLSLIGKSVVFAEWIDFLTGEVNGLFTREVIDKVSDQISMGIGGSFNLNERSYLFICRSGVRSVAAAMAMTSEGFSHCYNVLDGFEGVLNEEKKRGQVNGWKFSGLPWYQA